MINESYIRRAQSRLTDARGAVREFHAAVAQPRMALVIFFCSSDYDLGALAGEMARLFAGVQVIGCTTAGEVGPVGYLEHSLSGASFPASHFKVVSGCVEYLQQFGMAKGQNFAQNLLQRLESQASPAEINNSFAFQLVDGLSVREELVTRSFQSVLGKLPLIGGSAGDGTRFGRTHVYFDGSFRSDSCVLALVSTSLPFRTFATHDCVATEERVVVTEADPALRLVKEINGLPAVQEYARIVGVDASKLSLRDFATWSFIILIDGSSYVRSIQKINQDGSMTLFCAIENGLVLRIAQSVGLLENLERTLAQIRAEIGSPRIVICSDCVHRKLDIDRSPDRARVVDLLSAHKATGFNSYGEQFNGLHVNRTFVGVAIGDGAAAYD